MEGATRALAGMLGREPGHAELTLNDIARILEVSESRVSQIRSKAIGRLRKKPSKLR